MDFRFLEQPFPEPFSQRGLDNENSCAGVLISPEEDQIQLAERRVRLMNEKTIPFEQCRSCSGWFPIEAMQWDEQSQGYVCSSCFPIVDLW